jgi:hypothetical protein
LISVKSSGTKTVQYLGHFDFGKNDLDRTMCSSRDVISAVKMPQALTARVDAWAEAHGTARSDAICRLVELGLTSMPSAIFNGSPQRTPAEIELLAEEQIGKLLDPELPDSERERRIRRLTEGPPEFSDQRIDLAKRRD